MYCIQHITQVYVGIITAFTVESIKLIIAEFVKSDKPKACSGFNVSAVETPESPQSVLNNNIYMYETY